MWKSKCSEKNFRSSETVKGRESWEKINRALIALKGDPKYSLPLGPRSSRSLRNFSASRLNLSTLRDPPSVSTFLRPLAPPRPSRLLPLPPNLPLADQRTRDPTKAEREELDWCHGRNLLFICIQSRHMVLLNRKYGMIRGLYEEISEEYMVLSSHWVSFLFTFFSIWSMERNIFYSVRTVTLRLTIEIRS